MHENNIVHRDIKPQNILITGKYKAKLGDFGVSQLFEKEEDDKISKTEGTYHFMAPECCDRSHYYFDLFSWCRQLQRQRCRHLVARGDSLLHDIQRAAILGRNRVRNHPEDPQRRVRSVIELVGSRSARLGRSHLGWDIYWWGCSKRIQRRGLLFRNWDKTNGSTKDVKHNFAMKSQFELAHSI